MTMRLKYTLVVASAAAAVGLTSSAANAQDTAQGAAQNEGQYAADLRTMITQTASGVCPADIMAEQLLTACQQQLPQMSAGLSSLGGVQSITFAKADEMPEGRVETYKVVFANGVTLNWGIGHKKDGKYAAAYATP
jgi:hypothetical protein